MNLKKNKYRKRIKTYAQVLGIKVESNEPKMQENKSKTNTAKIVKDPEDKNDENLKSVIQGMKEQIKELHKIIQVLCDSIVKDDEVKQKCIEKMNKINVNSEKYKESKSSDNKEDEKVETEKIMNQMNKGKRKDVEEKQDIKRITTHPNAINDESGNINNAIRSWYRSKKETKD